MAQQRVTDMTMPPGVTGGSEYSYSGQAGGGTGSVFGDLGGPGQQHGTTSDNATFSAGPRNQWGVPTNNPSGDASEDTGTDIADAPPMGSVFGDLGGSGVAGQTSGQPIPAAPVGSDSGGQGGR